MLFVCLVIVLQLAADVLARGYGGPVTGCPNNANSFFVSDSYNRCVYYWCVGGSLVRQQSFPCAPGTGTPAGYNGFGNPCTEQVSTCMNSGNQPPPAPPPPPPTTTPTPTTTTTQVTPSAGTVYPNLCVAGGNYQASIFTEDQCRTACQLDVTCRGVDFDRTTNSCWFHTDATVCGFLVPQQNCNHYRFTTCATGTPIAFPATHALGGTFQQGVTDPTECISLCQVNPTCAAIDFDAGTTPPTCWFHTVTTCPNIESKVACIHLRIQNC